MNLGTSICHTCRNVIKCTVCVLKFITTHAHRHMSSQILLEILKLAIKSTRNTVSNAHKMIPPAPPCFVFAYFTVGNLKINQIKMYNRMWGMSSCNI